MIQKEQIKTIIEQYLQDKPYELINLNISNSNDILVEIDAYEGVDLDACEALNRYLQDHLDREAEDYSLEVGSVSLTDPFKTKMQYEKNLGHEVEILQHDGKKVRGTLVSVDDLTFDVDVEEMVSVEGKKRKQKQIRTIRYAYQDNKYVRYMLKF